MNWHDQDIHEKTSSSIETHVTLGVPFLKLLKQHKVPCILLAALRHEGML